MEIDIGNLCTGCGKDTAFGSGDQLFVNRIPSGGAVVDAVLVFPNGGGEVKWEVVLNGYMCVECQQSI